MPEETIVTAQTSEAEAAQDGVAGTVENTEDNASDAAFTDADAAEGGEDKSDTASQTKEQNAEYARRRREAERRQELKDMREKTILETLGGKNPYTNADMKDSADVEEYLTMREIEKNGGDPVADFAKFHKEKARTEAAREKADAESAEWYSKDREAFAEKYPEVSIEELSRDESFLDYADGKVGRVPLAKIYEGYTKLVGDKRSTEKEAEQKARDAAARAVANKRASVGSLANANGTEVFYTREQVNSMSITECEKNYDKIVKSMAHW